MADSGYQISIINFSVFSQQATFEKGAKGAFQTLILL
jgi:hypothetical protein